MDIWSSYWQRPQLACTSSGGGIGYSESLVAVWRKFFVTLEDGARLLDIGTGNGAVAIMANDAAKSLDRHFEIHACDQADIDPAAFLRGTGMNTAGISFHAGTPAERTNFPDAYFDAVTGQFALEYTDMQTTVAEISRILRPGGRARFVLHLRGSMVYVQTQHQLRDIRLIQDELRLLEKARAMMTSTYAFESGDTPDETLARRARDDQDAFMRTAKIVHDAIPEIAYKELYSDMLQILSQLWRNRRRSSLEKSLSRLAEVETEVEMARKRHQAMCEAALDSKAMQELTDCFCRHGFALPAVERLRLEDSDERDFAWGLITRLLDGQHGPQNGQSRPG